MDVARVQQCLRYLNYPRKDTCLYGYGPGSERSLNNNDTCEHPEALRNNFVDVTGSIDNKTTEAIRLFQATIHGGNPDSSLSIPQSSQSRAHRLESPPRIDA